MLGRWHVTLESSESTSAGYQRGWAQKQDACTSQHVWPVLASSLFSSDSSRRIRALAICIDSMQRKTNKEVNMQKTPKAGDRKTCQVRAVHVTEECKWNKTLSLCLGSILQTSRWPNLQWTGSQGQRQRQDRWPTQSPKYAVELYWRIRPPPSTHATAVCCREWLAGSANGTVALALHQWSCLPCSSMPSMTQHVVPIGSTCAQIRSERFVSAGSALNRLILSKSAKEPEGRSGAGLQ